MGKNTSVITAFAHNVPIIEIVLVTPKRMADTNMWIGSKREKGGGLKQNVVKYG